MQNTVRKNAEKSHIYSNTLQHHSHSILYVIITVLQFGSQWAGVALSVSYSEIKSITYYLIPAIPPERRNTWKAEHMSYLYFKPRTYVPTRNKQWVDPKFQQIITLLESCSSKSQLVQILAQLIRTQLICDSFLASQFIYLICSSSEPPMVYVRKVFDQIP